jgi:hypothetical protein
MLIQRDLPLHCDFNDLVCPTAANARSRRNKTILGIVQPNETLARLAGMSRPTRHGMVEKRAPVKRPPAEGVPAPNPIPGRPSTAPVAINAFNEPGTHSRSHLGISYASAAGTPGIRDLAFLRKTLARVLRRFAFLVTRAFRPLRGPTLSQRPRLRRKEILAVRPIRRDTPPRQRRAAATADRGHSHRRHELIRFLVFASFWASMNRPARAVTHLVARGFA